MNLLVLRRVFVLYRCRLKRGGFYPGNGVRRGDVLHREDRKVKDSGFKEQTREGKSNGSEWVVA